MYRNTSSPPYNMISLSQMGQVENLNLCWEKALHLAKRIFYSRKTIIPHASHNSFYYLSKGRVGIYYTSPSGRDRLTLLINPGCIFNEARTLSGLAPDGRFVCMQDSEIWRFPQKCLEDPEFIRAHTEQITNLLHSMGAKILIHYLFLAEMGTGSHRAHLCRFILALANTNKSHTFACSMTQQEVADLLGIHRITVARIIKSLKKEKVISSFTSQNITIENFPMLCELALE